METKRRSTLRKSSNFDRFELENKLEKLEKLLTDLVPIVPESNESCKLTLPDGKTVELPILN